MTGPSEAFVRQTRNPDLARESLQGRGRYEPAKKQPGDLEMVNGRMVLVRETNDVG